MRSAPTTERATWWRTPALRSAVTRFVVEVVKNSITARSSNEGEFETSTTTEAPSSTSGSPSPVSVLTPELGDAATASSSSARRQATTFEPIRPVPPMTTIFMGVPYLCRDALASAASGLALLWVAGATRDCWFCAGGGALSPLGRPAGPSAERLTGAVRALSDGACARAPSLISVRAPGWLRVGDMMVDGVVPQIALRPPLFQ